MTPQHIKFFKELSKNDVHIAGGKGASLGEMTRAGIPVPPGFVLTRAAFDRFLEETDLDVEVEAELRKVNYKDVNSVDKASNVIRDLIHDERMPKDLQKEILGAYKKLKAKDVAVRSSATAEDSSQASWAGELETYLNTTEKNLIGNVKKCWSSLFTPRAIVYRNEKGMRKSKVSVAVVVQAMVQAEIAGVMFTVHPVTKDHNQMIIEAVWGLGEVLVGGQITPDSYVVDKRDWSLIDVTVAPQEKILIQNPSTSSGQGKGGNAWVRGPKANVDKQKLSGKEIVAIAKLGKTIEAHYGLPEDIEWVYLKKKFYIVQSRPITTL
ncbi:MAG: PEP/pyruvate-binding domain-containing protein [bacterium]|nr:PEP/pyruvate-binding domain-containing protein [bacterium]